MKNLLILSTDGDFWVKYDGQPQRQQQQRVHIWFNSSGAGQDELRLALIDTLEKIKVGGSRYKGDFLYEFNGYELIEELIADRDPDDLIISYEFGNYEIEVWLDTEQFIQEP